MLAPKCRRYNKSVNKAPKFLLGSVVFHGLLLLVLWQVRFQPPPPETFEITLTEPTPEEFQSTSPLKHKSSQGSSKSKQENLGRKILSAFPKPIMKPEGSRLSDQPTHDPNEDTYLKDPLRDNPNAAWGAGAATFERTKDYLLYRQIYERVDQNLYYPGVLARHRIDGVVNARFVLNAEGKCDWRSTRINGANPYLRLFILDILKKSCQQDYSRYLRNRLITNVDLSFKFALTESDAEDTKDREKMIVGNTLLFFRNTQTSVMEWELGPFKGVFPIPAVFLNIPWIQENWDRLLNHQDPMQEFKKEFGQQG